MSDWMIRSALAGVVLAAATWLGSLALGWLGRPRRWVWAGGLLATALMPFLGLLLPARPAPVPAANASPGELMALLATNPGTARGAPAGSLPWWLPGAIWAVASVLLLLEQAYIHRRLAHLGRGWTRARLDGTDVLIAEQVGPAVVGVIKPAVVVPPWLVTAPQRERRMVLAHEAEHVRAGDTRFLAAGSLLTALLPWSPALWWLQHRLRQAVETDCDARVLGGGHDLAAYAGMLIEAASRPGRPLARVALVERRHHLERRIRAMKAQLPSRPLVRAAAVGLPVAVLLAAACELSSPPRQPTETQAAPSKTINAQANDLNRLVATDTGEIRRIILDSVPGGQRTRLFHKGGRVEVRYSYPKRPFPDSASAYGAGYAAGRLAAEQDLRARVEAGSTIIAGGAGSRGEGGVVAAGYGQASTGGATIAGQGMRVRDVAPLKAAGTSRPVVVVDGRASSMEALKTIDPAGIVSVNVVKVKVAGTPDTIFVRTR